MFVANLALVGACATPTCPMRAMAPPGTGLGVTHCAWTCRTEPKQGVEHDLILL